MVGYIILKKRFNIVSKIISGEGGSIDPIFLNNKKQELILKLSSYNPENIFNADELHSIIR